MSKKTIALIAALLLLVIVLVWIAANPKKPLTTSQNVPGAIPTVIVPAHTMLSLSPNSITISKATPSQLMVNIDTTDNKVNGVQMEITYNPKLVKVLDVTPGTFLTGALPLRKIIDNQAGHLTYILALPPQQPQKQGKGTVAILSIQAVTSQSGQSQISFANRTLVTSEGIAQSVVKNTTPATIKISQ